jgi:hypothetical protein
LGLGANGVAGTIPKSSFPQARPAKLGVMPWRHPQALATQANRLAAAFRGRRQPSARPQLRSAQSARRCSTAERFGSLVRAPLHRAARTCGSLPNSRASFSAELFDILSSHSFKRVFSRNALLPLLNLLGLARINTISQLAFGEGPCIARRLQRKDRIDSESQCLLPPSKAISQAPQLATFRRRHQKQPFAIGYFEGPPSWPQVPQLHVCQRHVGI